MCRCITVLLSQWAHKSVGLFFVGSVILTANSVSAATYYLDAANGDDGKDGKTAQTAYQSLARINSVNLLPGDSVLFKAGSKWAGQQFSPKGSGVVGKPIVVGKYGEGVRPIIAANGKWPSAIYLINQQYWELNDLDISNTANTPGDFRGIWVAGKDAGTLRHIYIRNSYVHNVSGVVNWISGDPADNQPGITFKTGWDASKRTGGIVFESLQPGTNPVATKFDDVLIEKNQISDCSFGGIITKQWQGTVYWGTRSSATDTRWVPHTNFIVRNNYISQLNTNLGCNGIYLTGIKSSLIEGNVVEGAGTSAIELYYADSVVIQRNETFGTVRKAGGTDYNGIDPDKGTTNIIVQYNYSHDNGDGILLCQFAFGNVIVRYNILQNNSRYQLYLHSDKGTVAEIYNNTLYNDKYNAKIVYGYGTSLDGTYRLSNNILVSTKTNAELTTGGGIVYDNNAYFGTSVSVPPGDLHKIMGDPNFVSPGRGTSGSIAGPAFASLDGYKLKDSSPLIGKGLVKANNGGKDFWGNQLYNQNPDVGAHEFGSAISYSITAIAAPGGKISQNPTGASIVAGNAVEFTAIPLHGWKFDSWSGDLSGFDSIAKIQSVNSNVHVNASFKFISTDSNLYEGEYAKFETGVVETINGNYSGTGYYNFDNKINSWMEFAVVVSEAGLYPIRIIYANGTTTPRPVSVSANGKAVADAIDFPTTEKWDSWKEVEIQVDLLAGINTIVLKALTDAGGPNIDAIQIVKAPPVRIVLDRTNSAWKLSYQSESQRLDVDNIINGVMIELIAADGRTVFMRELNHDSDNSQTSLSFGHLVPGRYFIRARQVNGAHQEIMPVLVR